MASEGPTTPQNPQDSRTSGGKALVVRGIAWTTGYRVFAGFAQFGVMLVLVRIIPPAEYGRAGAIVGLLTFVNAFSCAIFINQAIQLREGVEPDWSLHWHAGIWIQAVLFIVTNAVATGLWWSPDHASIAPLLHIASLGLVLESASSIRSAMLRRDMAFRRMRILDGISKLVSIVVMLSLGVAGYGAFAIVLGANVVPAITGAFDLLLIQRWRPAGGWLQRPSWADYVPAIKFGLQQSWSAMLQAVRGAAEAFAFPALLGFTSLALLQRAQALFGSTVGQVNSIFAETVYPLLPQRAGHRERYQRIATEYLQAVAMIVIVGATFVAWQGKSLLRVLYGQAWIAADPLIVPAVAVAAGLAMFTSTYGVIIAKNELKRCFILDIVGACLTVTMLAVLLFEGDAVSYAWALAAGQLIAATVAIGMAARHLEHGWFSKIFLPPLTAAVVAAAAVHAITGFERLPMTVLLMLRGMVYVGVIAIVVRLLFPHVLSVAMNGLPGGNHLARWLRLSPGLAAEP